MKKRKRIIILVMAAMLLFTTVTAILPGTALTTQAHSGRTDSYGGHRDNKNVSGLGYYHYHCGGYPAHLHPNGYCPYKNPAPSNPKASLNYKSIVLLNKQTATLKIKGSSAKATYSSGNSKIASVSKNGTITGIRTGSTTITVKVDSQKLTCKVQVQIPRLSKSTLNLWVKKSSQLKVTGTNQKVTWRSSNSSIAKVSNGRVTGMKPGKATVYAKVMGRNYACKVTVKK